MGSRLSMFFLNLTAGKNCSKSCTGTGFVKNKVLSLKKKDTTPVTVSVTALAEFDEKKNIVFINGIVQDITGFVNPQGSLHNHS